MSVAHSPMAGGCTRHAAEAATAAELAATLGELLPPPVATAVIAVDAPPTQATAAEHAAIAGAGSRRRREFLAGRHAAHTALQCLGADTASIGRGPGGEPVWPAGVVGSLTHTHEVAAAGVATTRHCHGLGLDVEPLDPPLDAATARFVCGDTTPRDPAAPAELQPYLSKLVFCAKECVHKALHPAVGRRLDVGDVAVDVDAAAGRWHAGIAAPGAPPPQPRAELAGRVAIADGHILAATVLAATA